MGREGGFLPLPEGFMTRAIHEGQEPEQWNSLCVVPPICMSTIFKLPETEEKPVFVYNRVGNPTRNVLERSLASLDDAKYGVTFSSGLGAITSLLSLLKSGDHIICEESAYSGTNELLTYNQESKNIQVSRINTSNLGEVKDNIKENTKMIWLETPSNPLLRVCDIKTTAELCKKYNIQVVVDNTFLTSYFQRPLHLGADIVLYSLTKYHNGHSDILMGAIVTNSEDIDKKLRYYQYAQGIVPSPFDCSQVNRSLKTLGLRMRQHSVNGLAVAKFLQTHPKIIKVNHPALNSHPDHDLFRSQCSGHSGMVSFYLKGNMETCKQFMKNLKLFLKASSCGGTESVVQMPILFSAAVIPEEQRRKLGITDNLVRLSVGLEDVDDIIADLKQALDSL